jgi:hypothetical protein
MSVLYYFWRRFRMGTRLQDAILCLVAGIIVHQVDASYFSGHPIAIQANAIQNHPVAIAVQASTSAPKKSIKEQLKDYATAICTRQNGNPDIAIDIQYSDDGQSATNYSCMTISDHTVWTMPVGIPIEVHI